MLKIGLICILLKVEDEITPFETNYITGIKEMIDIDKFQKIMSEFIGNMILAVL